MTASTIAVGTGVVAGVTLNRSVITGTSNGILWNNGGVLGVGPTTTNSSGDLLFVDGTADIGKNGATRPRNIFASNSINGQGSASFASVQINAASAFNFATRTQLSSTVDGNLLLQSAAGGAFGLLQLGGTTSSFPAIKRNGAGLDFRVADDTGYATMNGGQRTVFNGTALTAGGSTVMSMIFSSASIGIYVGSGAPTISAAQGSIYLRSDGSTTATRLYVNTNGTTGWTNFTSAA